MTNKIEIHEKKVPEIHEEWKDIVGYEGLYMVSSLGNVKSLERLIHNKGSGGSYIQKEFIRKKVTHKKGYDQVMLSKRGLKLHLVHRLVAFAFLNKNDTQTEVNHKNGIKTDNRVENLEWCNRSENEIHKSETGLRSSNRIIADCTTGIFFISVKEASENYNIKRTTLSRFLTGRSINKTNLIYV